MTLQLRDTILRIVDYCSKPASETGDGARSNNWISLNLIAWFSDIECLLKSYFDVKERISRAETKEKYATLLNYNVAGLSGTLYDILYKRVDFGPCINSLGHTVKKMEMNDLIRVVTVDAEDEHWEEFYLGNKFSRGEISIDDSVLTLDEKHIIDKWCTFVNGIRNIDTLVRIADIYNFASWNKIKEGSRFQIDTDEIANTIAIKRFYHSKNTAPSTIMDLIGDKKTSELRAIMEDYPNLQEHVVQHREQTEKDHDVVLTV